MVYRDILDGLPVPAVAVLHAVAVGEALGHARARAGVLRAEAGGGAGPGEVQVLEAAQALPRRRVAPAGGRGQGTWAGDVGRGT